MKMDKEYIWEQENRLPLTKTELANIESKNPM